MKYNKIVDDDSTVAEWGWIKGENVTGGGGTAVTAE